MQEIYSTGLSKQAIDLYKILSQKGALTALQIGRFLDIHQHAVYRLADHLKQIGMVEEIPGRPKLFRVKNISQSRENYLSYQRSWFDEIMRGIKERNIEININKTNEFQISFIQEREQIFEQCAIDLQNANRKANFIVLGLKTGISPELLLEQKNAVERGVPVNIIVQEYSAENKIVLQAWKQAGLNVRYGKPIGFHLLLIDDTISYLMTYDPQDKLKRYATRIVHRPINQQLQLIFEKYWKEAKVISFRNNF
ncbi:hypothetical protein HY357_00350 [Candidatus Roizmanbacteria bacterium]|nr:hypothetical protein [Candidatus Roizmanbacteria bacterium]